jgi:5S rRNA maturation endonuclease (ribonuclease M5)
MEHGVERVMLLLDWTAQGVSNIAKYFKQQVKTCQKKSLK